MSEIFVRINHNFSLQNPVNLNFWSFLKRGLKHWTKGSQAAFEVLIRFEDPSMNEGKNIDEIVQNGQYGSNGRYGQN